MAKCVCLHSTTVLSMELRTLYKILFYVLCILGMVLIVTIYDPGIKNPSGELIEKYETQVTDVNKSNKIILFWTSFFGDQKFSIGFGQHFFLKSKCLVNNCVTTADRRLINKADALIFHIRDLLHIDLPSHRTPNQKYVFFLEESPVHTLVDLSNLNNFFNWTMTYRRDSDIFAPYGHVLPKNKPSSAYRQEIDKLSRQRMLKLGNKTKLVAWFVSNCHTHSEREKYVEELQKYIPVDIYGKCGPYTCHSKPGRKDECFEMIEREYKFYLSFENSLCKDYVTEKLYHALEYDVIPIVLGGGNYSALAPPHSVIDTQQFSSPSALAKYLWRLHFNLEEYATYFHWKPAFEIGKKSEIAWCQLCAKLNTYNPLQSYKDINAWWAEKGNCTVPENKFSVNIFKSIFQYL